MELSGSDALAEDKLFATLDALVRRITLPNGTECLLSDTVGFINKLPHDLVNAFRSTLEEVRDADLILHVIDASSPYYDVQIRVVEEVLGTLGALDTPTIEVFNQCDRLEPGQQIPSKRGGVCISAKTGAGLTELIARVEEALGHAQVRVELTVPYDRYDAMRLIREAGSILHQEHGADGTHVTAMLSADELWRVKNALQP